MEEAKGVFSLFGIEIPSTITTIWGIILILTLVSWLATRKMKDVPGPLQALVEIAITKLQGFFANILGDKLARKYFPILATFFIFIIVSNYMGILPGAGHFSGFTVPTACFSITLALGVVALFTTNTIGIKEQGLKHYLLSMAKPFAACIILFPLNILQQFIHPFSLALRLYGNLSGEETVTETLYEIFPILLPLIMNVMSLLFCFIQAMVFTMLLSIYIMEATEEK